MSRKIIVVRDEFAEEAEFDISSEAARFAAEYLNSACTDHLVDPETRKPYPQKETLANEIFRLGTILRPAGKER